MSVALLLMNGASASAQPEAKSAVPAAIEQCVRENAPAVEQAVPSLTDAVDFLVGDICAEPIAAEQERQRQIQTAAMRERLTKQCAAHPTKPRGANSEEQVDPCAEVTAFDFAGGWTLYGPNAKPPVTTTLAAKILLELRTSRMNATHAQVPH